MSAKTFSKERVVVGQVRDFLQYMGWRAVRNNAVRIPGAFQTEPGIPDYLFLRYLPTEKGEKDSGVALALWVEFKRPGARDRCTCEPGAKKKCRHCGQLHWHMREKARGGRVVVVDDFQWFDGWYWQQYGWLHGQQGVGQMHLAADQKEVIA